MNNKMECANFPLESQINLYYYYVSGLWEEAGEPTQGQEGHVNSTQTAPGPGSIPSRRMVTSSGVCLRKFESFPTVCTRKPPETSTSVLRYRMKWPFVSPHVWSLVTRSLTCFLWCGGLFV